MPKPLPPLPGAPPLPAMPGPGPEAALRPYAARGATIGLGQGPGAQGRGIAAPSAPYGLGPLPEELHLDDARRPAGRRRPPLQRYSPIGERRIRMDEKECDACGNPCGEEYFDAKHPAGPWGNFCYACFKALGMKLGIGKGQHYKRTPDGEWVKLLSEEAAK